MLASLRCTENIFFLLILSVLVGSASIFQTYFKVKIFHKILHNCMGVNLSNTSESWQKIRGAPVIFLTIRSKSGFCIYNTNAVCVSREPVKVT